MQRKQKRRLKAVARPDRVCHLDDGRRNLDGACPSMPGMGPIPSARDDEKAAAGLQERIGLVHKGLFSVQILEIDVRHPDDVSATDKSADLSGISRLVLDEVWPAIRIERYRRRPSGVCNHGGGFRGASLVDEGRRSDMNGFDLLERYPAGLVAPCARSGL